MRPSSLLLLAPLALLAGRASPAAADEGSYLVLKGGMYLPTADNLLGQVSSALNSGTLPSGGDVELGFGAAWGLMGVQFAVGYFWTNSTSVDLGSVPVTFVLQLRLPIAFVVPYLEAGVGMLVGTAKVADLSNTKASFMAPLGGGVDVVLGAVFVGAEARYLYVSPVTYHWSGLPDTQLKLSGVNVTANLGFRF